MPETFLDSFIRTTSDGKLQKLVVDNMDASNANPSTIIKQELI